MDTTSALAKSSFVKIILKFVTTLTTRKLIISLINITIENFIKEIPEIVFDIYRELYANSEPKADFDLLVENAEIMSDGRKYIPYNDYEIDGDLMDEIIHKHMIRNRLNKFDKQAIRIEVLLGCSPKTKLKNE